MKLPVMSEAAAPSPATLWRRFADVSFDHALALGVEIELPPGCGRGVRGDDPLSLPTAGVVMFSLDEPSATAVADVLQGFSASAAPRPRIIDPLHLKNEAGYAQQGYRRRPFDLMRLTQNATAEVTNDLLIVPIRAARPAYERWCAERVSENPADGLLPRHLDDPQYDGFVALQNGNAVAAAGLQSRGQIGLIADVFVDPSLRRGGVGNVLVARVIELAIRGQLTDVFAAIASDDEASQALFKRPTFVAVTRFHEWRPA